MYKKFIFFIVFLLLLSACKKEEVYYSPVLETNQTVIYQFKEENYYISQYTKSHVFHQLSDIELDNFTAIIIDENIGEVSSDLYQQVLNFMHTNYKIILIYYDSSKIKYIQPKVRINFNSMNGLVGNEITSYEIYGNAYADPRDLYIAQYCFMAIGGGIIEYMKYQ